MSAFRLFHETPPGAGVRAHRAMFANTRSFGFSDPDPHAWLRSEVATLGGGLDLWRVRSSGHEVSLDEADRLTYLLPLRGQLDVAVADSEFTARPGSAILMAPNRRRTRVTRPADGHFDALVVTMPSPRLNAPLRPAGRLSAGLRPAMAMAADQGEGLRAYVAFLAAELVRAGSPLARPGRLKNAAAMLEELIDDLVRTCLALAPLDEPSASIGVHHVRRAEDLMRARFDEPLSIADISSALGVNLRSLQNAFRQHRGLSPREVLTRMRLDEARRRLSDPANWQSVSSVALDSGFTHLSRFSAIYHRAFGELPSETSRRTARRA